MQQDISPWHSTGQSAPRNRHIFWSQYWEISLVALPSMYVSWCVSNVCLVVYRINWRLGRVERMEQSLSRSVRHAFRTTDTSGDETDASETRRGVRSKRTYKVEKVWEADELSRFFVTGPTDSSGKPRYFHCQICRKNVFVKTHGVQGILRHYQATKHFPGDQRLRLETPGWTVLHFEGNLLREEEVELRRGRMLRAPQVVRDEEYPFSEALIVDSSGAVDVFLPVTVKVSALIEALRSGGRYELLRQLWSQFIRTLWLLREWTWTLRGHEMRCWLEP